MLMALLSEKGFCHQNAKKGSSATETVPNTKSLKKNMGGGVQKLDLISHKKEIITCFHNSFSISCFSLMHQVRCNIFS